MAIRDEPFYGADERTARLARVYDQEMDEPGDTYPDAVLRYRELDERFDGLFTIRMLWDSMSEVLPVVIEVQDLDGGQMQPIHVVRVEGALAVDAFLHPFAY